MGVVGIEDYADSTINRIEEYTKQNQERLFSTAPNCITAKRRMNRNKKKHNNKKQKMMTKTILYILQKTNRRGYMNEML